jgi:hypothetical protein
VKEFIELKLGIMTMDEYKKKFLDLLRYFNFIKDEKVIIKRFLRGIPSIFNDNI